MADTLQLDRTLTINEIVALHPETISVFNRFGMDTCCGGGVTVDEAARRHKIDANAVVASSCHPAANDARQDDRVVVFRVASTEYQRDAATSRQRREAAHELRMGS